MKYFYIKTYIKRIYLYIYFKIYIDLKLIANNNLKILLIILAKYFIIFNDLCNNL